MDCSRAKQYGSDGIRTPESRNETKGSCMVISLYFVSLSKPVFGYVWSVGEHSVEYKPGVLAHVQQLLLQYYFNQFVILRYFVANKNNQKYQRLTGYSIFMWCLRKARIMALNLICHCFFFYVQTTNLFISLNATNSS